MPAYIYTQLGNVKGLELKKSPGYKAHKSMCFSIILLSKSGFDDRRSCAILRKLRINTNCKISYFISEKTLNELKDRVARYSICQV